MCACAAGGWRLGRWLAAGHGGEVWVRCDITERLRVRSPCVRVWLSARDGADNRIGDAGAVALAKALESGKCLLTSLDLRHNIIGRAGAAALAKALESGQCQLTSLDVVGESMERRCAFHTRCLTQEW